MIREPHWWPAALTPDECDDLASAAQPRDAVVMSSITAMLDDIAENFWRLPVTYYAPSVKTYAAGQGMSQHTDYDPAFGDKFRAATFGASIQLSDPDDYVGGDVLIGTDGICLPRLRGTIGVWDALTPHRVTPVISGSRSALTVFAVGWHTIADARAAGWPDKWYG